MRMMNNCGILLVICLTTLMIVSDAFHGLSKKNAFFPSVKSTSTVLNPSNTREYAGREFSIPTYDRGGAKPYAKLTGPSSRSSGRDGGRDGGRRSFGSGRGGSFNRRPESDSLMKLRFKTTVKIDPELKTSIDDMNFSDKTTKALKAKGFSELTPVQSQSYSHVYSGEDLVARSRTGTGKTLAFGLPLIEKLVKDKKNLLRSSELPVVIILEPTRELALQVAQELGDVASVHGLKVAAMFGGASMFTQERDLRNGVHILVCTPGRCLDHISRGNLDLSSVEHIVLDEGDTMLEMGFQNDVETIIKNVKTPGLDAKKSASRALESGSDWDKFDSEDDEDDEDYKETLGDFVDSSKVRDVQTLLFSATMPGWICKLTSKHMKDPIFLDAVQEGETRLANTLKHYAIRLQAGENRVSSVSTCVEDLILTHGAGGQTILFTNTKDEADNIAASECFGQLRAEVLHGDISQAGRQATIRQFKQGAIDVLVATDVAARGLDIKGVDLVLHSGPPNDHDTYVHRSGRAGRAGRNGTVIMLYTYSSETKRLEDFERMLNFRFEKASLPSPNDIARANAKYAAKKLQKIEDSAVEYFLPHAKDMIHSLVTGSDSEGENEEKMTDYSPEDVSKIVARCMAALSNKHSIEPVSLLTKEKGKMTMQLNAVFKNGTSPSTARDWQRVFVGLVRRALSIEDVEIGRVAMGRDSKTKQICGFIDVETIQARTILKLIKDDENVLPKGIELFECETVPFVIEDNSRRREGGDDGDRYGGDRNRERSYGGDRDRGRGRSYGPRSEGSRERRPSYSR